MSSPEGLGCRDRYPVRVSVIYYMGFDNMQKPTVVMAEKP